MMLKGRSSPGAWVLARIRKTVTAFATKRVWASGPHSSTSAEGIFGDVGRRGTSKVIHIFIADNQAVVREGIKRIVGDIADMRVVGDAQINPDLSSLIDPDATDLVIVDVSTPSGNGLEMLQAFKQAHPWLPVLVFSGHLEHHYAIRAFKAGAKGYLTKDCPGSSHEPQFGVYTFYRSLAVI